MFFVWTTTKTDESTDLLFPEAFKVELWLGLSLRCVSGLRSEVDQFIWLSVHFLAFGDFIMKWLASVVVSALSLSNADTACSLDRVIDFISSVGGTWNSTVCVIELSCLKYAVILFVKLEEVFNVFIYSKLFYISTMYTQNTNKRLTSMWRRTECFESGLCSQTFVHRSSEPTVSSVSHDQRVKELDVFEQHLQLQSFFVDFDAKSGASNDNSDVRDWPAVTLDCIAAVKHFDFDRLQLDNDKELLQEQFEEHHVSFGLFFALSFVSFVDDRSYNLAEMSCVVASVEVHVSVEQAVVSRVSEPFERLFVPDSVVVDYFFEQLRSDVVCKHSLKSVWPDDVREPVFDDLSSDASDGRVFRPDLDRERPASWFVPLQIWQHHLELEVLHELSQVGQYRRFQSQSDRRHKSRQTEPVVRVFADFVVFKSIVAHVHIDSKRVDQIVVLATLRIFWVVTSSACKLGFVERLEHQLSELVKVDCLITSCLLRFASSLISVEHTAQAFGLWCSSTRQCLWSECVWGTSSGRYLVSLLGSSGRVEIWTRSLWLCCWRSASSVWTRTSMRLQYGCRSRLRTWRGSCLRWRRQDSWTSRWPFWATQAAMQSCCQAASWGLLLLLLAASCHALLFCRQLPVVHLRCWRTTVQVYRPTRTHHQSTCWLLMCRAQSEFHQRWLRLTAYQLAVFLRKVYLNVNSFMMLTYLIF